MSDVVVIDYGMGNIKSVQRGLEKVGARVEVSADPERIVTASRLLLPGVGAFKDGMKGLEQAGVIPAINEFVQSGRPLLGICLGMQMLLDRSEEHGVHQGLGYIHGSVSEIPRHNETVEVRKIPHIGWSAISSAEYRGSWDSSLLNNTAVGEYFYFVHSYMAVPKHAEDLLAVCDYEGLNIAAAVQRDNVTGLQFHPEKSCESGLRLLRQFVQN
jgi:glutamine amidotransferase